MLEYVVHTSYNLFHVESGSTPFRSQTHRIIAPDKKTAKEIAWNRILSENAACKIVAQSARRSRSKKD